SWIPPYNLACLMALSGRSGQALDALDSAVSKGFRDRQLLLKDKDLAGVRDLPRFRQLVEKTRWTESPSAG
ncbi:MAG: TPR end-of-group domain-containing protein, partial [Acidimicrobiales bacterium]